jgi:hypothetical protein
VVRPVGALSHASRLAALSLSHPHNATNNNLTFVPLYLLLLPPSGDRWRGAIEGAVPPKMLALRLAVGLHKFCEKIDQPISIPLASRDGLQSRRVL